MGKLKEINFHITDACQAHCPMCYATEEGTSRKHGDIEDLKLIVHNAIVNGEVERFVMVGGDPCEHPHLVELLKYIKEVKEKEVESYIKNIFAEYKEKELDIFEIERLLDIHYPRAAVYNPISKTDLEVNVNIIVEGTGLIKDSL